MDTNTKKRILVVDDDNNLRNIMVDALKAAGFETDEAVNGEDGLKKVLETHPDLMFLDVTMPKMTGWEVLEKLRHDPWGAKAKVIMLTSMGDMSNIAHAMDKKVFTYIVKSDLNLNEIGDIVNKTIANKIG